MTELTYIVNYPTKVVVMKKYADVVKAMKQGALSYQKRYTEVKPSTTHEVTFSNGKKILVESYKSARDMVKACKGATFRKV